MRSATLSLPSVRRHRRAVLVALSASAALAASPALAGAPLPTPSSPLLWATVDVCDSPSHPDTIGIRGSMQGTGDASERMYMQFFVEYRSASGHWHYLGGAGDSGLVAVGDGSLVAQQAGRNFVIVPSAGRSYTLRGIVVFEWRLAGRTLAQAVRATSAGHRASAGADPPGFSAASCRIVAGAGAG
jgi:hypothetical protein